MTVIYYTTFKETFSTDILNQLLLNVSTEVRERFLSYKFLPDRYAFLLGRVLLNIGLAKFNNYNANIIYTKYGRPYLLGGLDFNISHSNGVVTCVISNNCKVGIDVEEVKEVDINDFKGLLTEEEFTLISRNEEQNMFYTIWTKKEAIMKADGRGISNAFASLNVGVTDDILLNNQKWYLYQVETIPNYICHFACNNTNKDFLIERVYL